MTKIISPKKIIIEMNEDGTFKNGLIMYRIATDGVWDPKVRTMGISGGIAATQIAKTAVNTILDKAIKHILKGEGIL